MSQTKREDFRQVADEFTLGLLRGSELAPSDAQMAYRKMEIHLAEDISDPDLDTRVVDARAQALGNYQEALAMSDYDAAHVSLKEFWRT